MTESTWEKNPELADLIKPKSSQRIFYIIAFVVLASIVGYLIVSGLGGGKYYITVDELVTDKEYVGQSVRVGGAVDGDYIFNQDTQTLEFTIAHIPNDAESIREAGGLAEVLHLAVEDPTATRIRVVYQNAEIPDLLQHEAQAIIEGELAVENGEYVFYADKVQLKCPTRYSEENPENVIEVDPAA